MTAEPVPDVAGGDRTRVLFFGSGGFAVPVLEALTAVASLVVVGVVTAPDRPSGRDQTPTPTPVASTARALGLPLFQPAGVRTPEVVATLRALAPDVGVLADYGRIIPAAILALLPHGILNVHPSLLPRHRGASPVAGTILAGDPEGGVTVMVMDEGLDTGPLLGMRRWPLRADVRAPELEAAAAQAGSELIVELLPPWLAGEVRPVPQDDRAATATRPFRREDGRLDPRRPADELERRVRALDPWPGTWLETRRGRLAVLQAAVVPSEAGDAPGRLVPDGTGIALATVDGRLRLLLVRPEGGRAMPADAWLRGAGRDLSDTDVVVPLTTPATPVRAMGDPSTG